MATQMRKRDKKKEKAKAELKAKKRRELFEELDKSTSAAAVATGGKDKGKKLGHRQRVSETICTFGRPHMLIIHTTPRYPATASHRSS
jgi:hypothetical protein